MKIEAELLEETEEDATIDFRIQDAGQGIPADKIDFLFEEFTQLDGSATRRCEGTGLGLAISRHLAELMHSHIRVDSQPDAGSTFAFTLRFVKAHPASGPAWQPPPAPAPIDPLPKAHLLVAEDNLVYQKVAIHFLRRLALSCDVVSHGKEAIEAMKTGTYAPALIDVHMPEKDGLEATIIYCQYEKDSGKHLPIIALTADSIKGDRDKYILAGMDDYITKPIRLDVLTAILRKYLPTVLA